MADSIVLSTLSTVHLILIWYIGTHERRLKVFLHQPEIAFAIATQPEAVNDSAVTTSRPNISVASTFVGGI
jgi:hypothetical protein